MSNKQRIYRIQFHNQDKIYEVHARSISQDFSYGFIEIADMIFGEQSELLVNPAEEKLKAEFAGVKRSFIPMHAVIRIDEVEQEGQNKIHQGTEKRGVVTSFPLGSPGKGDN